MRKPTAAGAPPEELAKALMRRDAKPSEQPRKRPPQRERAFALLQWPEDQTSTFREYRGDSDSGRDICTFRSTLCSSSSIARIAWAFMSAQMAAEILICHFRPFRLSGMDYIHRRPENSQPLDIIPQFWRRLPPIGGQYSTPINSRVQDHAREREAPSLKRVLLLQAGRPLARRSDLGATAVIRCRGRSTGTIRFLTTGGSIHCQGR